VSRRHPEALPAPTPLRALPEAELTSSWDRSPGDEPLVSICCTAYNQVQYVRDAIEGFLAQRTTFPFEVLVQDDASTDGTADVIREYAASHPGVVRVVLREENLYSKNGKTLGNVLPLARGRWIAVCEGDDFWIRSDKLQTQIDRMTRDGTALSAHPALGLSPEGATRLIDWRGEESRVLTLAEEIASVHPMASTVFDRAALAAYEEFRDAVRPRVGDVYMQAVAAMTGGCSYVGEVASVYRERAEGSTTIAGNTGRAAYDAVDVVRSMAALAERSPAHRAQLVAATRRWVDIAVFDILLAHLDGHPVKAELMPMLRSYGIPLPFRARVLALGLVLPRGIGVGGLRAYRRARARRRAA
jgi:hypothetical protein